MIYHWYGIYKFSEGDSIQAIKKVFNCKKQEINIAIRNLLKYASPIFSDSKKN